MPRNTMMVTNGGVEVTAEVLNRLPTPEPMGPRHRVVHPAELLANVREAVQSQFDRAIVREDYALSRPEMVVDGRGKFISLLHLEPAPGEEGGPAIANIMSTDESISWRLAAGYNTLVCDNLCCSGEYVMVRKHTTNLDIQMQVTQMVAKVIDRVDENERIIAAQRELVIDERVALQAAGQALVNGVLPADKVRDATVNWLDQGQVADNPEVAPRDLWALHGAYTRQLHRVKAHRQVELSVGLGAFFATLATVIAGRRRMA